MRKDIWVPANAMVLLVGPSGSGKSSAAQWSLLCGEDCIVSSDRCRYLLSGDENNQKVTEEAFVLVHTIADLRMKLNRMVVIDATNLLAKDRAPLVAIAEEHRRPVVYVLFMTPMEVAKDWNRRRGRVVPDGVIEKHYKRMQQAVRDLRAQKQYPVYEVDPREPDKVHFGYPPIEGAGFDIISDVHSCADELFELRPRLGYDRGWNHPEGRKAVFVGDFLDRGPAPVAVMLAVFNQLAVLGNHDHKLLRLMDGAAVKLGNGLEMTWRALAPSVTNYVEGAAGFKEFLRGLPRQLRLRVPGREDLVVTHAGIPPEYIGMQGTEPADSMCLYGKVVGFENGLPIRDYSWAPDTEKCEFWQVHGHTKVPEPTITGKTINIDTGCYEGGALTALRWPEMEFVSVPAQRDYTKEDQ